MSREITFKDIKLKELLEKRNKIVLEGREQDAERQRLEEELKKKGLELQKIDGQATDILKKKNIELTVDPKNKVFEQIMGASLKDGKIVVEIADRVEDYVLALEKQKKELDEKAGDKTTQKEEEVKEGK